MFPGKPAKQHDAFLIGDWSDRLDHFRRRLLAQEPDEDIPGFPPPDTPESAASGFSDICVKVLEKIKHGLNGSRRKSAADASASIGADLRVVVMQKGGDNLRRKARAEIGRGPDSFLETGALHRAPNNQPRYGLGCPPVSNHDEGVEHGRLLGNDPVKAEADETPA